MFSRLANSGFHCNRNITFNYESSLLLLHWKDACITLVYCMFWDKIIPESFKDSGIVLRLYRSIFDPCRAALQRDDSFPDCRFDGDAVDQISLARL